MKTKCYLIFPKGLSVLNDMKIETLSEAEFIMNNTSLDKDVFTILYNGAYYHLGEDSYYGFTKGLYKNDTLIFPPNDFSFDLINGRVLPPETPVKIREEEFVEVRNVKSDHFTSTSQDVKGNKFKKSDFNERGRELLEMMDSDRHALIVIKDGEDVGNEDFTGERDGVVGVLIPLRKYKENLTRDEIVKLAIQINGKVGSIYFDREALSNNTNDSIRTDAHYESVLEQKMKSLNISREVANDIVQGEFRLINEKFNSVFKHDTHLKLNIDGISEGMYNEVDWPKVMSNVVITGFTPFTKGAPTFVNYDVTWNGRVEKVKHPVAGRFITRKDAIEFISKLGTIDNKSLRDKYIKTFLGTFPDFKLNAPPINKFHYKDGVITFYRENDSVSFSLKDLSKDNKFIDLFKEPLRRGINLEHFETPSKELTELLGIKNDFQKEMFEPYYFFYQNENVKNNEDFSPRPASRYVSYSFPNNTTVSQEFLDMVMDKSKNVKFVEFKDIEESLAPPFIKEGLLSERYNGFYYDGVIYKGKNYKEADLEERLHYLNDEWLDKELKKDKPSEELKELRRLYEIFENKVGNQFEYITGQSTERSRLMEFMARGLSDEKTREAISKIEVDGSNLWEKIKDLIDRIMGKILGKSNIFRELYKFQIGIINDFTISNNPSSQDDLDIDGFDFFGSINNISTKEQESVIFQSYDTIFLETVNTDFITLRNLTGKEKQQKLKEFVRELKEGSYHSTLKSFIRIDKKDTEKLDLPLLKRWTNSGIFKELLKEVDLALLQEEEIAEMADNAETARNDGHNSNKESYHTAASKELRMFASFIPKLRLDKNGWNYVTNMYGVKEMEDASTIHITLGELISDSITEEEMMLRIENSTNPMVEEIKEHLPLTSSMEGKSFRNQFFKHYRQPITDILITKELIEGESKVNRVIKTTGNAQEKIESQINDNFYNYVETTLYKGKPYMVDNTLTDVYFERLNQILKPLEDDISITSSKYLPMLNDFYNHIGMDIRYAKNLKSFNDFNHISMMIPIRNLLNDSKSKAVTDIVKVIKNFNHKDGQNAAFGKLTQILADASPIKATVSTRTAEGKIKNRQRVPSSFSQVGMAINLAINNPTQKRLGDTQFTPQALNSKTFAFQQSLTKKRLMENSYVNSTIKDSRYKSEEFASEIVVYDLDGMGGVASTNKLSDKDYLVQQLTYLLNNSGKLPSLMEIPRAETAASTLGWGIKDNQNLWVNNRKETKLQLGKYLIAEALRVQSLQDKDLNVAGYEKEWSLFKGIGLDNLPMKIENNEQNEQRVRDWLSSNKNEIGLFIDNLLNTELETIDKEFSKNGLNDQWFKANDIYGYDANTAKELYAYNSLIHAIETSIVFYGGIEHYNKFYKRNKGMISTGTTMNTSDRFWREESDGGLLAQRSGDSKYDRLIRTAVVQDPTYKWTLDNEYYKGLREAFRISLRSNYTNRGVQINDEKIEEEVNLHLNEIKMDMADGMGYANLDFARIFLKSVGNWTDSHEKLYQWELGFDEATNKEEYKIANPHPGSSFPSIKAQAFGSATPNTTYSQWKNDGLSIDGVEGNFQVFDKFSLNVLIPSVVHDTFLEKVHNQMINEKIGYIKFESGSKLAVNNKKYNKDTASPMMINPLFEVENGEVTNANDIDLNTIYTLDAGFIKEQLLTNSKHKKETSFGSQFRKLTPQDIVSKNGKYLSKELKNKHRTYLELLNKLQEYNIQELEEVLGVGINHENGRVKTVDVKDLTLLIESLEKETLRRDSSKAVVDFLALIKEKSKNGETPIFELSSNKQTLTNLIQGLINRKLVKQKINGADLIQVASPGYVKANDQLKFYDYKNGKGIKAEAMIAMSKNFEPLLNLEKVKEYATNNNVTRLTALNTLITNNEINEKSITIVGKRIPTQGLASIDVLKIKKFLSPSAGPIVILPREVVAKDGSDYDIDKKSFFFPSFDKNGELLKSEEELNNQIDKILTEIDDEKFDMVDQINNEKSNLIKSFGTYEELLDFANNWSDAEARSILRKIKSLSTEDYKLAKEEKKRVGKEIGRLLKLQKTKYQKSKLINDLITNIEDMVLDKDNFHHLVTPLSDNIIKGQIETEVVKPKLGIDAKVKKIPPPVGINTLTAKTRLEKRKTILSASRLLGVAATATTFTQLYLKANIQIEPAKNFSFILLNEEEESTIKTKDGYNLSNPQKVNGIFKSLINNQYVTGTVDAPTNPYLGYANLTMENIGAVMYANMVGIPNERIIHLFNQPTVEKVVNFQNQPNIGIAQKEGFYLNRVEEHLNSLEELGTDTTLLKLAIIESNGKSLDNNFNMEKYFRENSDSEVFLHNLKKYTALEYKGGKKDSAYHLTQIYSLIHYRSLLNHAEKIFKIQQNLNNDTNTAISPMTAFSRSMSKLTTNGFISDETVNHITNNSEISTFFIDDFMVDVFSKLMPYQYKDQVVQEITHLAKGLKIPKSKKDKFYRTVTNDFLLYLVHQNKENVKDHLNEFPNKWREYVRNAPSHIKNTKLVSRLRSNDVYEINYLRIKMENDLSLRDHYTEAFEMIMQDNKEIAKGLALHAFYQNGYNRTFYSFAEIIPPVLLDELITINDLKFPKDWETHFFGIKTMVNGKVITEDGLFITETGRSSRNKNSEFDFRPKRFPNSRGGFYTKKDPGTPNMNFKDYTSKFVKGVNSNMFLPMQPENIAKIKAGLKTTTIRSKKLKDGLYKLSDNTVVKLSLKYPDKMKSKDLIDLDKFAKGEGFKNWEDFRTNNLFSTSFVNGSAERYIYNITTDIEGLTQTTGEEISSYSDNLEIKNNITLQMRHSKIPQAEQIKANYKVKRATKYIGFGNKSTKYYGEQLKGKLPINSKTYTDKDVVFVSVNGNVSDANLQSTFALVGKALNSGATVLTDSKLYLSKSTYNQGERKLRQLLVDSGRFETFSTENENTTQWKLKRINEEIPKTTEVKVPTIQSEAFERIEERKGNPQTVNDLIADYLVLGKVTWASFKRYVDPNFRKERLNFIRTKAKGGQNIDVISESLSNDTFEISTQDIADFITDNKSITDYWKKEQESLIKEMERTEPLGSVNNFISKLRKTCD